MSATHRTRAPALAAVAGVVLVGGAVAPVVTAPVALAALITPANSTAQVFAGSTYYGVDWPDQGYGSPQVVPFYKGPQGIIDAIDGAGADPAGTVVLSSGWGAGQTGTALATMRQRNDPALDNIRLVILDNNSNRAGGGFWTTYAAFAPLLATSAAPSPNDLGMPTLDVSYEYNINSAAPTYPLNLLADLNSLLAYVYGYGGQATAPVPDDLDPGKHYVLDSAGHTIATYDLPAGTTTTYVTFKANGLPLVQPLRALPGGDILADAIEPVLTVLVNWGYQDNSPIPADPTLTRPAGLLPSAAETATALGALPGAVAQGIAAVQHDLSPSSTVGVPAPAPTALTAAPKRPAPRHAAPDAGDRVASRTALTAEPDGHDGTPTKASTRSRHAAATGTDKASDGNAGATKIRRDGANRTRAHARGDANG